MKKILLFVLSLLSLNAFSQGWNWNPGLNGDGGNQGGIGSYKSEKDIDYVGDNATGHKMDI